MSSFGEELRRERELRQITLREISESTKINVRYLEALERNDFTHLPGGVFNKGFVRAYAQHIGVDPETMVNSYLLEESAQATDDAATGDVLRPSPEGVLRAALVKDSTPETESARPAVNIIRVGVIVAVIAGLAVAAWFGFAWFQNRNESSTTVTEKAPSRLATTAPVYEPESEDEPTAVTDVEGDRDSEETARTADPASPPPAVTPVESTAVEGEAEEPAVEAVEETPQPPARESRLSGTNLRATVELARQTSGRLNCDNRRVETLDGLAPGTRMSFDCRTFLLIDVEDGGALLLGIGDEPPEPIGADGVPVNGHHVAPPPEPRGETP